MKKYDKEILQKFLGDEKQVMKDLEKNYIKALADIKSKIKILIAEAETTQLQSKIYQLQYQQSLERQISGFVKAIQSGNISTIKSYLKTCYEDGFIGNNYSLQQQNIPLLLPIDQGQVIKAISRPTDGYTLSQRIYKNVSELQSIVKAEISRGIASNLSYADIARNVSSISEADMNKAKRIARTEGHRVQNQARMDSMQAAKRKGADIVKQWDATLDGATRPEHAELDGQIVELDEDFTVGSYSASAPGMFGDPYMDCNCRCHSLQKARNALAWEDCYTKHLGKTENMTDEQLLPTAQKLHIPIEELRKYSDQIIPLKASSYEDFKQKYNKIWHYEGSDLQKEAEARIASYKKKG